jgi:MtfA peptidase
LIKLLNGYRRHRLRSLPLPTEWERVIEHNVGFFESLSSADRRALFGNTQVLLAEKRFEGCGGLELTDEIRVTVAAYAAVLLLGRDTDYYPRLTSVLVYPSAYVARGERHLGDGIWEEGDRVRLGETGLRLGAVVIAWDDVPRGREGRNASGNVVLHEFAHQLDFEDHVADGTPLLEPGQRASWSQVFGDEYERLRCAVDAGEPTVLDPYGAKNRVEFFAVATEAFFCRGGELQAAHSALYRELRAFYHQHPAAWSLHEASRPAT